MKKKRIINLNDDDRKEEEEKEFRLKWFLCKNRSQPPYSFSQLCSCCVIWFDQRLHYQHEKPCVRHRDNEAQQRRKKKSEELEKIRAARTQKNYNSNTERTRAREKCGNVIEVSYYRINVKSSHLIRFAPGSFSVLVLLAVDAHEICLLYKNYNN